MKKQSDIFELQGISKPRSFTCRPLYREDHFWAKSEMPYERFDALFDYFSSGDMKGWKVKIEHDGLTEDGSPINPLVVETIEPEI